MTYKEQQKLYNLRKQVKDTYLDFEKTFRPEESKKAYAVWIKALNKLEAFEDKLYSKE